tara:strand:- start:10106 stop:10420 length:315 start_codon:yes stop_codon:yes gene_type:complete
MDTETLEAVNGTAQDIGAKNPRCKCGRRAHKFPILRLGHAVAEIPMALCNKCAKPEKVLAEYDDELHAGIAAELRRAGRPVPHKSQARVTIESIRRFTGAASVV